MHATSVDSSNCKAIGKHSSLYNAQFEEKCRYLCPRYAFLYCYLTWRSYLVSLLLRFPTKYLPFPRGRFDKVLSNVVCFFTLRNQVSSFIRRHQDRFLHECCCFVQLRESTFLIVAGSLCFQGFNTRVLPNVLGCCKNNVRFSHMLLLYMISELIH